MIKGKHLSRKVKEAELEKVQEKKNTEKKNMLKEAEPRRDYTDRQCLATSVASVNKQLFKSLVVM